MALKYRVFHDAEDKLVQFHTQRNKECSKITSSVLTDPIEYQDDSAQTYSVAHAETQTEATSLSAIEYAGDNLLGEKKNTMIQKDVKDFLQYIGPLMLDEIEKTFSTHAFDDFHMTESDEVDDQNSRVFSLSFDYISHFKPTENNNEDDIENFYLQVTGVSWNSNGSVIAASYGRFDHSGWCNYRSALCLWNIFGPQLNPNKPDLILETSCGLMSVAFHPSLPSIVAAGSYNGEVYLWDTNKEEMLVAVCSIGDYCHRDPVTSIAWVFDVETRQYEIASASGEGKVLIWNIENKLRHPVYGYILQDSKHESRVLKERKSPKIFGGICIGFRTTDKYDKSFIVGTEGGAVFKCLAQYETTGRKDSTFEKNWSATANNAISRMSTKKKAALKSHVESYANSKGLRGIGLDTIYESQPPMEMIYSSGLNFDYQPHIGDVYGLSRSPFHRNLFLTCSADGSAKLFNSLQAVPVHVIYPSSSYLYSVAWSRTRPTVFAAGGGDGNVFIYDMKENITSPSDILEHSTGRKKSCSIFSIDFNPRQRNFLACGDNGGLVHIWKLRWKISNAHPSEEEILENFINLSPGNETDPVNNPESDD